MDDIVSLETAREAFRLGFDEHTKWGYDWDNGEEHPTQCSIGSSYKNDFWKGNDPIGRNIAAPLKVQYQQWLRKNG